MKFLIDTKCSKCGAEYVRFIRKEQCYIRAICKNGHIEFFKRAKQD